MVGTLFLLLCYGVTLAHSAAPARPVGDFDLYILVRSYSPTFCKQETCSIRPINSFTIHGLWPEYENGGRPEFCTASNATSLAATDDEDSLAMGCEWPSFAGPNALFWDHEWDKHGTCAEPRLGDRSSYFQTVLELNQKYDINVVLEAAGITPSGAWAYPTATVQQTFKAAYGVAPVLRCYMGAVEEVWMCMSLDLQPIPCPAHVTPSCGKEVHLPTGNTVSPMCSKYFPHAPKGWGLDSSIPALIPVAVVAAVFASVTAALIVMSKRWGEASLEYVRLPSPPSSP